MKTLFGWLAASLVIVLGASYGWMHLQRAAAVVAAPGSGQTQPAAGTSAEAQGSEKAVTLVGPLAEYMAHQGAPKEDVQTITYKPVASDYVGGSVVGTSLAIMHDKFRLSSTVDLPFEVPAHASMPHLHGNFQSYIQTSGKPSSDTESDVEFMLLNDQQYIDFLAGRAGEALFSADATHDQEVNATLPPTLREPVKYHLVFHNVSRTTKKVVQADFRVDF